MLYRVFPHLSGAGETQQGGALFVPRERQGTGRHDNPEHYGALYASRLAESAVAERIQAFRGQEFTNRDLRRPDGKRYVLATLDDSGLQGIVDLDDPAELARRDLKPSTVATRRRLITRSMALSLFQERASGFEWWSMFEASWPNVTLFAERAASNLLVVGDLEFLHLEHPILRRAAESIGVRLAK